MLFTHASGQTSCYPVDIVFHKAPFRVHVVSYHIARTSLLVRHPLQSHFYADDSQFYNNCRLQQTHLLRQHLSTCVDDINLWCKYRLLWLNASKTEAIWFGSKSNLAQLNRRDCTKFVRPLSNRPRSSAISASIWTLNFL